MGTAQNAASRAAPCRGRRRSSDRWRRRCRRRWSPRSAEPRHVRSVSGLNGTLTPPSEPASHDVGSSKVITVSSVKSRVLRVDERGGNTEDQRALMSSEPWTGFAFSFSLPTRKEQVLSMPRLMLIGLAPLVTACGQRLQSNAVASWECAAYAQRIRKQFSASRAYARHFCEHSPDLWHVRQASRGALLGRPAHSDGGDSERTEDSKTPPSTVSCLEAEVDDLPRQNRRRGRAVTGAVVSPPRDLHSRRSRSRLRDRHACWTHIPCCT